ncbi:inner centromere protein A [Drosophila nasuta]|uniref:inner centromere protein A n=1 Tax=Drosophila nasuta TaxID=42062 RepID=UPI00295E465B|nr:inner centromere protein A [Drosophila nasuta]
MEDLLEVLRNSLKLEDELNSLRQTYFEELDQLFYGITPTESGSEAPEIVAPKPVNTSITPQQTKKRPKRLASLAENEDNDESDTSAMGETVSQRSSLRKNNSQLLAVAQEEPEEELNTTGALMPPPPIPAPAPAHAIVSVPVAGTPAAETSMSGRPQRAAKLRSEKNLKEPSLNSKLRRPSNDELIQVKLECEQRASQAHLINVTRTEAAPLEVSQAKAKESSHAANTTGLRVMLKREKLSCDSSATLEATKTTLTDETTVLSNTTVANSTATVAAVPAKRGRKKKEVCKPIKVERFSDLDKPSPVSSRTRQGSNGGARNSQESQAPSQRSIYEDAIEEAAPQGAAVVNKTMNLPNVGNVETTFNVATGNATVTLNSDATFQVADDRGDDEKEESMETARQGSMPKTGQENSLLTDDESIVDVKPSKNVVSKMPPAALKATKMATRAHELFNPLLQSPVKMRVEAFENAANAQSSLRSKRVKEVAASGSNTTPVIGKLQAPALGRFLTPTQSSSVLPVSSSVGKKAPMSAKAAPLMKASTTTNLKTTNSTSNKTLSRENSGDDFRKGLHQLAEERKKQREQKHLQAAQQREVKERERAERLAKLAKEREEKRLKKEKMEERKRQEMEELQRKMQQQDEAERLKKAKLKEQEREMLHHMKMQQSSAKAMMPPPPKSKYTFEMLHEDDSTDDEGKVSHKRPPVPNWSRSHVRGPAISMQSHCPTDVIDSFFSVEPTTPDLKQIFPNIDPSHLKRNSSVLWSTPPRYSELPKY